MTCLAVANKGYTLGKIDVNGAFIQTKISGTLVYIKCMGTLKEEVLDIISRYRKYVGEDGILYCKLKKALYSCIQVSKLWYNQLKRYSLEFLYVRCEVVCIEVGKWGKGIPTTIILRQYFGYC
jgi:hypothetical protein